MLSVGVETVPSPLVSTTIVRRLWFSLSATQMTPSGVVVSPRGVPSAATVVTIATPDGNEAMTSKNDCREMATAFSPTAL